MVNMNIQEKQELLKVIFTKSEIQQIWNGLSSWASYQSIEKSNLQEAKKYARLADNFDFWYSPQEFKN
tara:strand:- start:286 stop:489 length:204 start_codon:yes stop_codon:yes gene_type:complete